MCVKWPGVIACYLLLATGLYVFILRQHRPLEEAFLFGLVVYGVYDTTNYATLNEYTFNLAITDALWGGILTSLVTASTYFVLKNFY